VTPGCVESYPCFLWHPLGTDLSLMNRGQKETLEAQDLLTQRGGPGEHCERREHVFARDMPCILRLLSPPRPLLLSVSSMRLYCASNIMAL
jgi:hypothetical protein